LAQLNSPLPACTASSLASRPACLSPFLRPLPPPSLLPAGGYEQEELAAEAYDIAAIKANGRRVITNFDIAK
jgi:hypothetical protein